MKAIIGELDSHYLNSILNQLKELDSVLHGTQKFTMQGQVLYDNIDWLECFIECYDKRLIESETISIQCPTCTEMESLT